jgi:thiol-disulfide isomerase/thioredoxin
LAIFGTAYVSGQSVSSAVPADGLELLKRVAQHYADAKSYRIEEVRERESHSEFSRNWQKTVMTAAEAPGNRFHYEGRSMAGDTVRGGDGKTVWTYEVDEHRYTQKPFGEETEPKIITLPEMALREAQQLRENLGHLANGLKSATRLEDATLSINGREIACYRVRIQTSDLKRSRVESLDKTIWIDKSTETVVRSSTREHIHVMMQGRSDIPEDEETTTTYSAAELDRVVPDELFTFTPPSDARLVKEFPNPLKMGPDLSGEPAPPLKFKSPEGNLVTLDSFRGKPVLLDIWATWCAPCVKGLEAISRIYEEAKGKGLVLLSVDEDEEAKTAADLLAKKNYTWPNFHDDGQIGEKLRSSNVPRTLLIDGQGKIVYDTNESSEDDLRAAVAQLGPEYASMAPKPKQVSGSLSK